MECGRTKGIELGELASMRSTMTSMWHRIAFVRIMTSTQRRAIMPREMLWYIPEVLEDLSATGIAIANLRYM